MDVVFILFVVLEHLLRFLDSLFEANFRDFALSTPYVSL